MISKFENTPFIGPQLNLKKKPALIYLALSDQDSLLLDPYNQPAQFASDEMRVFSFTLPYHQEGFDKMDAMTNWANALENGEDIFEPFLTGAVQSVYSLIEKDIIDPDNLFVGGLSRGAFLALHLMARMKEVQACLGFAPLIDLHYLKEFDQNPLIEKYDLKKRIPDLFNRKIRFYIGNRDERVGTKTCFSYLEKLTEYAYDKKVRSPLIEMMISPSTGFMGHGTLPHVFSMGIDWLKKQIVD